MQIRRTEISENLFNQMKKRDDIIRAGGVGAGLPSIKAPKRKALTQASSPVGRKRSSKAVKI
jgi:hypothetical protein